MNRAFGQLVRYGIVGIASNLVGYFIYLGLTRIGVGPKTAMSLLYAIGVAQTFVFNKSWTFTFKGPQAPALFRYSTLYAAGYLINYYSMALFVDQKNIRHEFVMAALTVLMAIFFFLGQKFWVFPACTQNRPTDIK
ncbi:GtrA family protein [Paucibacter sp. AS339]|uniref:GtrA family protein n=1 Tax=Paucibacter hankyongi TaxID=3133434 RepID=UPI00309DC270